MRSEPRGEAGHQEGAIYGRMRVHGEERQEPKNIRKAEEITKMSDTYMERQMRHRRCSRTIPAQM